jgi:hypothetical protein
MKENRNLYLLLKKKSACHYISNNIGIVRKSTELNELIPLIDKKLLEQKNVEQASRLGCYTS